LSRARVLEPGARLAVVEPGHDLATPHRVAFVDQKLGNPACDGRAKPRVVDRLDDAGRIDGFDRCAAGWVGRSDGRRLKQPTPGSERERQCSERRRGDANHRRQRHGFEAVGRGIAAGSRAALDGTINSAASGSCPRASVVIARLPFHAAGLPVTPAEAAVLDKDQVSGAE
jgi:hypothetical protein